MVYFSNFLDSIRLIVFDLKLSTEVFCVQVTAREGRPILICEEGDTETGTVAEDVLWKEGWKALSILF